MPQDHKGFQEFINNHLHNAQSPLSAMSGYLELMRMFLNKDDLDTETIERYRLMMENCLSQISDIFEDIHQATDSFEDLSLENSNHILCYEFEDSYE